MKFKAYATGGETYAPKGDWKEPRRCANGLDRKGQEIYAGR
jgi:hypothetical protein